MDEDMPIEHNMVTKAIESAQVRVEGHNFDMRKHLLEYDDVVNQQRQVIYEQRRLVSGRVQSAAPLCWAFWRTSFVEPSRPLPTVQMKSGTWRACTISSIA